MPSKSKTKTNTKRVKSVNPPKPVKKTQTRASFSKNTPVSKTPALSHSVTDAPSPIDDVAHSVSALPTTDGLPVQSVEPVVEAPIATEIPDDAEHDHYESEGRIHSVHHVYPTGKLIVYGCMVLCGMAVITGLVFLGGNFAGMKAAPVPVVVTAPAATPTPTPYDRSAVSFAVQNGSGKSGLGAKAAKALEDRGYTVVSVGNADKRVKATELYVIDSVPTLSAVVLADLTNTFGVSSVVGVPKVTTASALLIIGPDFRPQ